VGRVIDANGMVLAHVYGEPDGAIAASDSRLTNDEACRISKLITRLPELVELEKEWNSSRRKPRPLRFKPVTIGDLIREGKLLEVHCASCRPERHLYLNPEILRMQAHAGAGSGRPSRVLKMRRPGTVRAMNRSGRGPRRRGGTVSRLLFVTGQLNDRINKLPVLGSCRRNQISSAAVLREADGSYCA
jgi:hypothetical protein